MHERVVLGLRCACGSTPWKLAELGPGGWTASTVGLAVWLNEHGWHGEHDVWQDAPIEASMLTGVDQRGYPLHEAEKCPICWQHRWWWVWGSLSLGIEAVGRSLVALKAEAVPFAQAPLFPSDRVGGRRPE